MMRKFTRNNQRVRFQPKNCYFCESKTIPAYKEVSVLQKYISERGKIIGRNRSGICAKHQRSLSKAIKYARHLAMLPFVVRA
jgi:small subunit ribosomal protein S18